MLLKLIQKARSTCYKNDIQHVGNENMNRYQMHNKQYYFIIGLFCFQRNAVGLLLMSHNNKEKPSYCGRKNALVNDVRT